MSRPRPALLVAAALVQVAFLAWFLAEPLLNVVAGGGRGVSRLTLLLRTFPHVVPGVRLSDSSFGVALEGIRHVENLPGRLPILLAAGLIAASAMATGALILRGLGIGVGIGRVGGLALSYGLGASVLGVATLGLGRLGWLGPGIIRGALAAPILGWAAVAIARRGLDRSPPMGRDPGGAAVGRAFLPASDRIGPAGRPAPPPALPSSPGARSFSTPPSGRWPAWTRAGFAAVTVPFVLLMVLGAMLPTIEFDATEYHLQGPKEYYQAGRIGFLPHNVYASMPFGVEMLHLLGMEVLGDWWSGALVGQVLIALFAPATAAVVALAAGRLGGPRAAWVAGVVYLTTPWVSRLAVNPFVEGPLCFYHAALIWVATRDEPADRPGRLGLLAGLLAGGAMAIKYPGVISAVIPFGLWAVARARGGDGWRVAAGYALGVALIVGPWLAKNMADTGNPVYPLAFGVFGGRDWDPAREARWNAVHGPRPVALAPLRDSVVEVLGRSDWQTPLLALLAPLTWLDRASRRRGRWLWAYAAYLFLAWWLLTHRLDRFWMPILAPLSILAGLGSVHLGARWLGAILAAGIGLNAMLCGTDLVGSTDWTVDLGKLRAEVPARVNAAMARMDAALPPGARVLLIGQAGVFHLDRPVVYNTVFNRDLFEGIARGRTPDEVRAGLARLGVDYVYVDWSEIDRYRSPGNYGFTDFETPEVFAALVEAAVLGPPLKLGAKQEAYRVLRSAVGG